MAYDEDWEDIATWIKSLANWHCEDCGARHDPYTGHCLTVHHLDGDKANNERENLKALCQRCHLKRQGRLRLYGPEGPDQMRLFPEFEPDEPSFIAEIH
uniref:Putative homing endonuclease n=1 Tax=viral metagenome TaxID=1070528 RepID=A0A6H1ZTN8_9ZZZZ